MTRRCGILTTLIVLLAAIAVSACQQPPFTLVERAIEARSTSDIIEDNRIVIDVNKIMADLGSIEASTEIYEQRLLITGIFDDKATYDSFRTRVRAVKGVKKLYWHAIHMSEAEQKRRDAELLDWGDALALDTRIDASLLSERGVANVNFRSAVDSFATVYILGRARSGEERKKALNVARNISGVKRVVDYVEVRP